MSKTFEVLTNRAIITLSGPERRPLLQGIITNNVNNLDTGGVYSALLTPQGKFLYDFFLVEVDETIYLDCEKSALKTFFQKLLMYRLRSNVEILDSSEKYQVLSSDGEQDGISFKDPRHPKLGYRTYVTDHVEHLENNYHSKRIKLGIPEGSHDYIQDKSIVHEGHFEDLNGVDFEKGCYVGQEVIARMKYRGKIKKQMFPVTLSGSAPEFGTEITDENGNKVGDIRSSTDGAAIALFRTDKMNFTSTYDCGNIKVTPYKPNWISDE
jgi:tRNA-modifying protein YgfZ